MTNLTNTFKFAMTDFGPYRSFRGCRIDHAKFREIARDVFGLERPVKLSRRRTRGRYGSHMSYPDCHNVMLSDGHTTIRHAVATLAHELWHCVQAESAPWQEYITAHRRETASYPYRDRPREVEAREAEELFWQDLMPCIIPPKR